MVLSSYWLQSTVGSPRGNGECGFCGSLDRHLWIAVWLQTINSGTVSSSFTVYHAHDFLPVGSEKAVAFSLPVHAELCGFLRGDEGCEGRARRLRQLRRLFMGCRIKCRNRRKCRGSVVSALRWGIFEKDAPSFMEIFTLVLDIVVFLQATGIDVQMLCQRDRTDIHIQMLCQI